MYNIKKFFRAACTASLLMWGFQTNAQTLIANGSCGANLTWQVTSDSVLTISGTGAMDGYSAGTAPWYSYRTIMKTVIIKDGVTSLGNVAFQLFTQLTAITIPNSVTAIGYSVFDYCTGLTTVSIPNSVKTIGTQAFFHCTSLNTIICNAFTPPVLGISVFDGLPATAKVFVPRGSVPLYQQTWTQFSDFRELSETSKNNLTWELTSDGTLTISGSGAMDNQNIPWENSRHTIKKVIINDGVTTIGRETFAYCYQLTSISIPDSVTIIDKEAFADCIRLTTVSIGNSVTTLGSSVFFNCINLDTIICSATTPPLVFSSTFSTVPTTVKIIVPSGSASNYQQAPYWNNFKNITEMRSITRPIKIKK